MLYYSESLIESIYFASVSIWFVIQVSRKMSNEAFLTTWQPKTCCYEWLITDL